MKKLVFYRCKHCGNIAIKLVDSKVPMFCCGEPMEILNANTNDGAVEKHIPVLKIEGNCANVQIGEVLHPMTAEHYIQFVVLETNMGYKVAELQPEQQPIVNFYLDKDEKVLNVYDYCNLHSLWCYEVE